MDDVLLVLKDLQPAAFIVVGVALIGLLSNMLLPQIGPWVSMLAVAGVTVYVGNRVLGVDPRPAWLLPLAISGVGLAAYAGYRNYSAIQATANNDRTIGYVFPSAIAVVGLWLSIALIEFDATQVATIVG